MLNSFILSLLALFFSGQLAIAAINQPVEANKLSDDILGRSQVLIYYANETDPIGQEKINYDTIVSWLKTSSSPKAQEVANKLLKDVNTFHKVVDEEIEEIKELYKKSPSLIGGVFIITNRLARKNQALILKEGTQKTIILPTIKNEDNYILANNPLSTPAGFSDVFNAVKSQFSSEKYTFVLITKSHGNEKMAMTPRLIRRHENYSQEKIISMIENFGTADIQRLGLPKTSYFEILGKHVDMAFSVVFLESCQSGPGLNSFKNFPKNIGTVITTGDGTKYQNIEYRKFLNQSSIGQSLLTHVRSKLPKPSPKLDNADTSVSSFPNPLIKLLYFLPLAILIALGAYLYSVNSQNNFPK